MVCIVDFSDYSEWRDVYFHILCIWQYPLQWEGMMIHTKSCTTSWIHSIFSSSFHFHSLSILLSSDIKVYVHVPLTSFTGVFFILWWQCTSTVSDDAALNCIIEDKFWSKTETSLFFFSFPYFIYLFLHSFSKTNTDYYTTNHDNRVQMMKWEE